MKTRYAALLSLAVRRPGRLKRRLTNRPLQSGQPAEELQPREHQGVSLLVAKRRNEMNRNDLVFSYRFE